MAPASLFSAVAAVLAVPAAARAVETASRGSGDDDFMTNYMFHKDGVPSRDTCSVDCEALCKGGMSKNVEYWPGSGFSDGVPFANSNTYCIEACVAHSIQTTMNGYTGWMQGMNGKRQGMYVQKVMAEYCSRGQCEPGQTPPSMLQLHKAEIAKHEHKEGEAWGYPAKPSGWPSTCETSSYYCSTFCENVYHEPTKPLGAHPGANPVWKKNQDQCNTNCNDNWRVVKKVFDKQCRCIVHHGAPSYAPHLVQESSDIEQVDVGSFMQLYVEL